jgi:hypothetical protein
LKESSESVVTTTLELNKLLLMYLDRIKSNTLSDNILFDMGKILKDKKQVICEHKKELYDGLMSDSASILGPIWASNVKVR